MRTAGECRADGSAPKWRAAGPDEQLPRCSTIIRRPLLDYESALVLRGGCQRCSSPIRRAEDRFAAVEWAALIRTNRVRPDDGGRGAPPAM